MEIKNLKARAGDFGDVKITGSLPFYGKDDSGNSKISIITNKFTLNTYNSNFLIDSDIDLSGSFENPVLGGEIRECRSFPKERAKKY